MSKPNDPISPNHYARFKIQPIEFIEENGIGFFEGNVIKYVCRYDAKNGLEDLKKARSYLDRMIRRRELKADNSMEATGLCTPSVHLRFQS